MVLGHSHPSWIWDISVKVTSVGGNLSRLIRVADLWIPKHSEVSCSYQVQYSKPLAAYALRKRLTQIEQGTRALNVSMGTFGMTWTGSITIVH